jgi:hypothetical protein
MTRSAIVACRLLVFIRIEDVVDALGRLPMVFVTTLETFEFRLYA